MRRVKLSLLFSLALILPVILLVLAGCSGGGGAITQPETGPGTSASAAFIQLLPAVQRSATAVGNETCGNCHNSRSTGGRVAYHSEWKQTRHAEVNVTCESCHGNGSVHAATPSKNNILRGGAVTSPIVCGQCHGPTHDQFMNSRHAGAVQAVVERGISNPSGITTCFRCHSAAFRVKMVDDPLAAGKTPDQIDTDIAAATTEQLSELVAATHESATCVTCHDPHRKTANLTSTGNQAYLRRATSSTSTEGVAAGAQPKTYSTFNHICASCHNGRGADGSDTRLSQASSVSRPNMHDSPQYNMLIGIGGSEGSGAVVRNSSHSTAPDQCMHCHMPNRRHTFTVSLDTSCAPCHTAADAAARSQAVRSEVQSKLLTLRTRMENWARAKFGKQEWWDYTSLISEEGVTPPTAAEAAMVPIEIRRARHNYYFVVRDLSLGVHNTPYARHLLNVATTNLDALGPTARAADIKPLNSREALSILERDRLRAKAADIKAHL